MTTAFKTQKIPFHLHSSHDNNRSSPDLSSLGIPLNPQLVLPQQYKATASMFSLTATNSFYNVSEALGNNYFFATLASPPEWEVLAGHDVVIRHYNGTYAEFRTTADAASTNTTVTLTAGETLKEVVTAINTAIGPNTVIKLHIDVVENDQHAIFMEVTKGLVIMSRGTSFKWITENELIPQVGSIHMPVVAYGQVILDSTGGVHQISDSFSDGTVDVKHDFSWTSGGQPTRLTLPTGIYSAQSINADGSFTAVGSALLDLGIEMEKVIIAFTGSSTSSQAAVPGVADSILVYSTGTDIVVKLLVTNDAYTLSIPETLERFLGIGDSQKIDGGIYPPYDAGFATDYTIPQVAGKAPRLDDFSTLQLRSGLVSSLSGEGKPAAILAQFHVPHGTAIGASFDILPHVPLETPCMLSNPCNELRFQLTNLRGEAADSGGNNWSASILLTIYDDS